MVTEVAPRPITPTVGPRPPAARPSTAAVVAGRTRSRLGTTPGRLRVASLAIVAAVVVLWVVGATTIGARQAAARQVGLATEPLLVGAQGIYAGLADADATAASAFLTGGLEPANLRARYDNDIKLASDQLADVTRQVGSSPQAVAAVRTMTDQVPVYTGLVEAARANNRQTFPVGAAYLRAASALMRTQILPAADRLYQVEATRLDGSYRSGASALDVIGMLAATLLALAALVATELYLMRWTNRVFNVPLLIATVLAIVVAGWAIGVMVVEHHDLAHAERAGSNPVRVLAQARILALKAESDESLSLVARGNGQADIADFNAIVPQLGGKNGTTGLLGEASRQIGTAADGIRADYVAYLKLHDQVQGLANGGKSTDAVTLAETNEFGSDKSVFAQLDTSLSDAVNNNQQQFTRDADAARHAFGPITFGLAVLALAIAVLALLGTQQRINDYR